ncbi:MAG: UDP-N-acetylglucosamine 2-epimerase (non-hydrolyzing) [Methanobacteriota archaeon]
MKVLTVVGARPQFIKASVVSPALRKRCTEVLVHTGQHYDSRMSEIFFKGLEIPDPDYNLGCGSGSHGAQTGKILSRLEKVVVSERPDFVLTYGDTNSTLAGALCAAKLHVRTGHVEAGLRSFNRTMPEEINRITADHVSDLLFCPTPRAVAHLADEGVTKGVHLVGDVMYDSALKYGKGFGALKRLGLKPKGYHLLTVHRPSNADVRENLSSILSSLDGRETVFPAHPRTVKMMRRFKLAAPSSVRIIEPQGYAEMLQLVRGASMVLTDSGGLQKEAYFLGTPCVTLRSETEWLETVEAGWNVLVGADKRKISRALETLRPTGKRGREFGDGKAAEKIVRLICRHA